MDKVKQDIHNVLRKYPLLKFNLGEKKFEGEIELISSTNGMYIDVYHLEIIIPDCFPNCFPKVIELDEKIPRTVSRHVMPKTNYLCLAVNVEEILICKQGITILWFMENVLIPRLCEEFRVNNGEKYQKEYSHDFGGTWEFLMKHLNIDNPILILKIMEALANKKTPKGNSPCICNSGEEYRLCHKKALSSLQKLKNEILNNIYNLLLEKPYKGVNL